MNIHQKDFPPFLLRRKIFFSVLFFLWGVYFLCEIFYLKPTVSVVLPTYNRGEFFLRRALDSILNQTFSDFEVIVIDDGSTDQTRYILSLYQVKDQRIKVIYHQKNKGLVTSLNEGIEASRGKYIARMDDDDISLPHRFEKQVDFLEKHPEITVLGSFISPIDSLIPYPFQREQDPDLFKIDLFLESLEISHPSAMMRRDFLIKHHIRYNDRFRSAEDRPFWADIMDAGGKIMVLPEVLLQYRIHMKNPYQYYFEQSHSIKDFHKLYFSRFCPDKKDCYFEERCDKMAYMIGANKEVNEVNQDKLEKMYWNRCLEIEYLRKEDGNRQVKYLRSRFWTDQVFIKKMRAIRAENDDRADVLLNDGKTLILKWDKYGTTEVFKLNDSIYILQDENI